nr:MAG TPA: Alginate and motility regulator [Caudoviricetes sp.]
MWQQKVGDEMSPRTGRPKSENPKSRQFRMRLTEEEFSNLEQVAKQKSMTKTEVVMRGIELVKSEITK